jgi:heme/copper-type cytochrome/quinol oxidase subunit 4
MNDDKWVKAWFVFCGTITLLTLGGSVWLLVYVVPHIMHLLDRIQ